MANEVSSRVFLESSTEHKICYKEGDSQNSVYAEMFLNLFYAPTGIFVIQLENQILAKVRI